MPAFATVLGRLHDATCNWTTQSKDCQFLVSCVPFGSTPFQLVAVDCGQRCSCCSYMAYPKPEPLPSSVPTLLSMCISCSPDMYTYISAHLIHSKAVNCQNRQLLPPQVFPAQQSRIMQYACYHVSHISSRTRAADCCGLLLSAAILHQLLKHPITLLYPQMHATLQPPQEPRASPSHSTLLGSPHTKSSHPPTIAVLNSTSTKHISSSETTSVKSYKHQQPSLPCSSYTVQVCNKMQTCPCTILLHFSHCIESTKNSSLSLHSPD